MSADSQVSKFRERKRWGRGVFGMMNTECPELRGGCSQEPDVSGSAGGLASALWRKVQPTWPLWLLVLSSSG